MCWPCSSSGSAPIVVAKAGGGMIAVPRDTLVEIPGVGEDKINVAFATGGPELTVETLENLTALPIDNYVVVHFDGVEDIVNALQACPLLRGLLPGEPALLGDQASQPG